MSEAPEELPHLSRPANDNRDDRDDLGRRLREAGSEELLALLQEQADRLPAPAVRQALRNPHCSAEVVGFVAAQPRLLSFYEVRRDLALHPKTPEVLALRFVPALFWRDLMTLGLDTHLRPTLRRAADLQLLARIPELAVGERVALARRASPGLLAQLRNDPNPRVIGALLDNSRLTEGILAPVLASASTPPAILDLIAGDRRWGVRYALKVALARNPRTPLETVLRILSALRKPDLKAVASDPRLPEPARFRARLLLGEA
jgi:hypothetical protein